MNNYKYIYFIGIGGIGMSALARYYKSQNYKVSGYDRTCTELTRKLEAEGIEIHYEDNFNFIPKDKDNTLVVYTPAIPKNMAELNYARVNSYKVVKRSAVLGELTKGQHCLAIAGTHGKTSTSSLVAHIFEENQLMASAFLGGISKNYNSNFIIHKSDTVVVEADEYDRSFLQLWPECAIITSMDPDHLDIYGDEITYKQAFKDFSSQVSKALIIKLGTEIDSRCTGARLYSYHFDNKEADFYADNIRIDKRGHYCYDLISPKGRINDIVVGVPGLVNAENSVGAAAICLCNSLSPEQIKRGIATFQGVKRRMDVQLNNDQIVYIDDYAHHPSELSTAINSIRKIFPDRRFTGIFQPHLYSRTRDFADGFAQSLDLLDKCILLDIYPARELPIEGVSSKIIYDKMKLQDKVLITKEELMDYLAKEDIDVLASFGAGNIDLFVDSIREMLNKRLDEKNS